MDWALALHQAGSGIGTGARSGMRWIEEDEDYLEGLFPAPNFKKRFGMCRCRHEELIRYWRFGPPDGNDKWTLVRPLLDAFNDCRVANVEPSWKLIVDESVSQWYGRHANNKAEV